MDPSQPASKIIETRTSVHTSLYLKFEVNMTISSTDIKLYIKFSGTISFINYVWGSYILYWFLVICVISFVPWVHLQGSMMYQCTVWLIHSKQDIKIWQQKPTCLFFSIVVYVWVRTIWIFIHLRPVPYQSLGQLK